MSSYKPTGLLRASVYIDLVDADRAEAKRRLFDGLFPPDRPTSEPPYPGGRELSAALGPEPRFPGALPKVWLGIPPRNPHFTGRDEAIDRLRASLTGGHATAVTQRAAVHGLGGIGKSELASEYAYRFHTDYDAGAWLRAEAPATLAADFAALAHALDLPEKDQPEQAVLIAAVCRWCERHDRWLLILDNAEQPVDLKDFLPRGGGGHVVITSRNPAWGRVAEALPVDLWPRAQSISFLMQRTESTDATAAGTIADALGDLPLALEQAAAYCEETGIALAGYAGLLEQGHGAKLRATGGEPERSVALVWDLSLTRIAKDTPAAAQLLNLCAFFAPERIPLDVIRDGRDLLPEPLAGACADPIAFDQTVAALRRFSLVRRDDDTLTIHRLVQAVTRDRLSEGLRAKWAAAVVAMISKALPAFPHNAWDTSVAAAHDRLDAHGLAAADTAERLAVAAEGSARLFNDIGGYRKMHGDLEGARALYLHALAICEQHFGRDHPEVAIRVSNIGRVLEELGDLAGAKACIERALAIDENYFGRDHPNVGIRVNNLGGVLLALGDLEGAKTHLVRALAIEQRLGCDHPNVATCVNNLGFVLQHLGNLEGAKAHLVRALAIDEQHFGRDHPKVAGNVNNLGSVLLALGDLEGAKTHLVRALAIDEQHFGPDHASVARDVNNLGFVLQEQGDLTGAKAHFERALTILRKHFPETHPNVKLCRDNLARVEALLASGRKRP